jgi:3-dehydroquinate dehydratase-2
MSRKVYILNGPNLDMLGVREPEIYGRESLEDIRVQCADLAGELGLQLEFRQTNHEGVMVDWLHEAYRDEAAVICNPAGLSFYSVPLLDALKILQTPYFEVHLSNIHRRDDDHRHSITAKVAKGVICGLGSFGYLVALRAAARFLE